MTPGWFHRDLGVGSSGPDVLVVHRKLGLPGVVFGETTAATVRGLQHRFGLTVSGVVDEATARVLGEPLGAGLPPDWWGGVVSPDEPGYLMLVERFGLTEAGVRRLQGSHGLVPSGVVDLETARLMDSGVPVT